MLYQFKGPFKKHVFKDMSQIIVQKSCNHFGGRGDVIKRLHWITGKGGEVYGVQKSITNFLNGS